MKNLLKIAVLTLFVMLAVKTTYAQEWTNEQSEVWKVVKDSWEKYKANDIDGIVLLVHEKYQGWSDRDPMPTGKAALISWYREMMATFTMPYYIIEPARIAVTKSAAVVDYYYEYSVTITKEGKTESKDMKGKAAEFYVKEDGKWLLIGDLWVHEDE